MPGHKAKIEWYWILTRTFCCGVKVHNGKVIDGAPILKRFFGQPFSNLTKWIKAIKGTWREAPMSLLGSKANFQEYKYTYRTHCSECTREIPAGTVCLVSMRNGVVKKRVCSEECRQTFDDRVWREIANKNEKRRKS